MTDPKGYTELLEVANRSGYQRRIAFAAAVPMGWELETVETPFVEQLVSSGWCLFEVHLDHPAPTGISSIRLSPQ